MSFETIKDFLSNFPDFAIQTFDDREGVEKDKSLTTFGRPQDYTSEKLFNLNSRGAGIFFTVNKFPLGKRTKSDCAGVNAWYVESDNLSIDEQARNLLSSPLAPSLVVRSKKSLHAYWLAKNATIDNFVKIQQGLVEKFSGDPALKDISRVLRIPGFMHNKTEPFLVELLDYRPDLVYTEEQMLEAFPCAAPAPAPATTVVAPASTSSVSKDDFWRIIAGINCKTVLQRLSGTDLVNKEIYSFRTRGGTGGEYIDINGAPANCWIDKDGWIGSGSKAGPTWIQWLLYYNLKKSDIAEFAKRELKDLIPVEILQSVDRNFEQEDFNAKKWQSFSLTKASDHIKSITEKLDAPRDIFVWGTKEMENKMPLIERGNYTILFGQQGCLEENTFISYQIRDKDGKLRNHKGGTIKRLYERFHKLSVKIPGQYRLLKNVDFFVKSIDKNDLVFRNIVADVVKSGKKECFELLTESGEKIVATKDHRFYIGDGKYIKLEKLKAGDSVYIDKNTRQTGRQKRKKYSEVMVKYHPLKNKKIIAGKYVFYRVKRCLAVVEAHLNNLTYDEYIKILNSNNKKQINSLKFLSKGFHIHHKNRNTQDDSFENLQVLDGKEHNKIHGIEDHDCLRSVVLPEKIISITSVGVRETYDIKCFFPHNNFIANGVVVHNSGKTLYAMFMARENSKIRPGKVTFLTLEMSKEQLLKRYVRDRAGISKQMYRDREFDSKIVAEILPELDGINLVGIDFGETYTVRDIGQIIEKTNTEILFIDNLNKIKGNGKSEIEITQNVSQELLNLTRHYNIPVVVVHHANKPSNLDKINLSKKQKEEIPTDLQTKDPKHLLKLMVFRGMSGMRGTNKTADDADIILEVSRIDFASLERPISGAEKVATGINVYKDRESDAKGKNVIYFWRGTYYDSYDDVQFHKDFDPKDLIKDAEIEKQIFLDNIAKGNIKIKS